MLLFQKMITVRGETPDDHLLEEGDTIPVIITKLEDDHALLLP